MLLRCLSQISRTSLQARSPINRVEHVTKDGGEALLVAVFNPSNVAPSFISLPKEDENKSAEHLRQKIAFRIGVVDRGFLGNTMFGAQLKD